MQIGFVPASSNTAGQPGHAPDQDPVEIIKDAIQVGYRWPNLPCVWGLCSFSISFSLSISLSFCLSLSFSSFLLRKKTQDS